MRQAKRHSGPMLQSGYYPSAQQPKKPEKKRFYVNPRKLALLLACVGVAVFSIVSLARYINDSIGSAQVSKQLREEYQQAKALPSVPPSNAPQSAAPAATAKPSTSPIAAKATATPAPDKPVRTRISSYPGNPSLTISTHFTSLRKRNDDIVGWITIDGLLDEAVVQRDNEYYLKRDYLGYHNATGALFLDEGCLLRQVPEQLLIHGHNMKTGAMFGILKKYKVKGGGFIKENPFIQLETLYENATYVIFAVFEADCRPDQPMYFDFISHPTFPTDEDFTRYVSRAKRLSLYRVPLEVLPGDRLLTLATCTGTDENTRLLVMARMLRKGEDEIELRKALYSITDN